MKTYTLDQLAYFTDSGMDRQVMLRSIAALGLDEDARFALGTADSTRNRDLVRLYWDYGDQYGAQLEALIDWQLAQEPKNPRTVAAAGASRYSLGQLAWTHAVGLFKDDMARGLRTLGVPADAVETLARAAAVHRTVLGVWKEQARHHGPAIACYLDACLASYTPGWPHPLATAAADVSHDAEPLAAEHPLR